MTSSAAPALRVAMIGYAFMGAAHSQAWRTAGHVAELPLRPEMAVVVGRHAESVAVGRGPPGLAGQRCRLAQGHRARRHRPGRHLHARRHPRRDRPRRAGRGQARAVREAAGQLGGRGRVDGGRGRCCARAAGDGRLHLPAHAGGRVGQGDGRRRHDRHGPAGPGAVPAGLAGSDENAPLTWRMDKEKAGSGALGDIGAHIIDAIEFVTGQRLTGVSGRLETFVKQRPVAAEGGGGHGVGGAAGSGYGPVTVDDAAVFFGTLDSGALASFEASPVRAGPQERHAVRDQRQQGQSRVRLREHECAGALRRQAAGHRGRVHPDPGHRTDASVSVVLVAARARAGLRARVHPSGDRSGPCDRVRRRRPADLCRRTACAAGAGSGRGQLGGRQQLADHSRRT